MILALVILILILLEGMNYDTTKRIWYHMGIWKGNIDKVETRWHTKQTLVWGLLATVLFVSYRVSWQDACKMIIPLGGFIWLVRDISWSINNGKHWWYCGNGKGELLENIVRWFNTHIFKSISFAQTSFLLKGLGMITYLPIYYLL